MYGETWAMKLEQETVSPMWPDAQWQESAPTDLHAKAEAEAPARDGDEDAWSIGKWISDAANQRA